VERGCRKQGVGKMKACVCTEIAEAGVLYDVACLCHSLEPHVPCNLAVSETANLMRKHG